MHQTYRVGGGSFPVVMDTLNQRTGAVANSGNGDSDVLHKIFPSGFGNIESNEKNFHAALWKIKSGNCAQKQVFRTVVNRSV
jgi:hypothetical protein